jgi:hypothetical protein
MADTFDIVVNGSEKQVKMTFGMLNILCRAVGDVDSAASVNFDPVLRQVFLVELLSARDVKGKITEPFDLDTADMDIGQAGELIAWAGDHVLDFFLKGLEKTKALQERHQGRIKALMPTPAGSAS